MHDTRSDSDQPGPVPIGPGPTGPDPTGPVAEARELGWSAAARAGLWVAEFASVPQALMCLMTYNGGHPAWNDHYGYRGDPLSRWDPDAPTRITLADELGLGRDTTVAVYEAVEHAYRAGFCEYYAGRRVDRARYVVASAALTRLRHGRPLNDAEHEAAADYVALHFRAGDRLARRLKASLAMAGLRSDRAAARVLTGRPEAPERTAAAGAPSPARNDSIPPTTASGPDSGGPDPGGWERDALDVDEVVGRAVAAGRRVGGWAESWRVGTRPIPVALTCRIVYRDGYPGWDDHRRLWSDPAAGWSAQPPTRDSLARGLGLGPQTPTEVHDAVRRAYVSGFCEAAAPIDLDSVRYSVVIIVAKRLRLDMPINETEYEIARDYLDEHRGDGAAYIPLLKTALPRAHVTRGGPRIQYPGARDPAHLSGPTRI